ncbi:hypothetical protein SAMN05444682_101761 [Parapedobacter indicus]|uniref:Uncharacterized protein n=1 Tax=Parapedobacter indicus TaxID=1477437 RepID=A0A1I3E4F4_9SPHI|nr:hypothetical protein CLV26_101775 [Parapedobacter indicus]SFH93845.1 hypothetical protein SAMN05444682_101761 [Parapedobacter indicus]
MTRGRKILLWSAVVAYYPIFVVGAVLISTSILIRCVGLLLTMDTNHAKREFQPVKRAFKKLLGYEHIQR